MKNSCFPPSGVSTCLTLKDVENELKEVRATDWYQLGLQLDITPGKLSEIETDHSGDVQRRKIEVLDWWLRNAREVSWKKLADALEKAGGYGVLAQRLRQKIPAKGEKHALIPDASHAERIIF